MIPRKISMSTWRPLTSFRVQRLHVFLFGGFDLDLLPRFGHDKQMSRTLGWVGFLSLFIVWKKKPTSLLPLASLQKPHWSGILTEYINHVDASRFHKATHNIQFCTIELWRYLHCNDYKLVTPNKLNGSKANATFGFVHLLEYKQTQHPLFT